MSEVPEHVLAAAMDRVPRDPVYGHDLVTREQMRHVLEGALAALGWPPQPEHGIRQWAKQGDSTPAFGAKCFCGLEFVFLTPEAADGRLQLHICGKLFGHGPAAKRHDVYEWAADRTFTWLATCACHVTVVGATETEANDALRRHFEEVNARG